MRGWALQMVAMGLMACHGSPQRPPSGEERPVVTPVFAVRAVTAHVDGASAPGEHPSGAGSAFPRAFPRAPADLHAAGALPAGYREMEVRLEESEAGPLMLLVAPGGETVLPVFINGTEGYSLKLRLEGKRYRRPLTHDLMDRVVGQLGAKVMRAQVDRLVDGAYHAKLILERNGALLPFDARPSDAVAIAIGHGAPVYASPAVLRRAGHDRAMLERAPPAPARGAVSL
ncbi:MAG: bifunctional nuclease family protein [Myxococcota bacterium]